MFWENHSKVTYRLLWVICAALVKWTSMIQQPHTHTEQTSHFHLLSPCCETGSFCIIDVLVL